MDPPSWRQAFQRLTRWCFQRLSLVLNRRRRSGGCILSCCNIMPPRVGNSGFGTTLCFLALRGRLDDLTACRYLARGV